MIALLALHGVVGLAVFASGSKLGPRSFLIGAVPPAATLLWLLTQLGTVVDGGTVEQSVAWVPALDVDVDLRLDGFAALMVLLIAGVGVAVFLYSRAYFSPSTEGLGRNAGLMTMFAGAMFCVVVADNLLVLYVGWELTSITSYLLIGNDHAKAHARAAALHALLITSAGGLAMFGGFVVLGQTLGTYRLSEVLTALGSGDASGTAISVALALVLVGAMTKSALYPFHSWLPGAMAAPTPVSAYLHSATMVNAGIYLIARFAPVAVVDVGWWQPAIVVVGLATMVFAGLRALKQFDLKLLLALGTVSQLGFLAVLFGVGTPELTTAGCELLLAHAVFKAALFMSVGALDRRTGTRDVRSLPALGPPWRSFVVATVVCAASMASIPFTFGFIAKEAAFEALDHGPFSAGAVVLAAAVIGSVLTVAYTARFALGALLRPENRPRWIGSPVSALAEPVRTPPGAGFVGPIAALATVTLVLGIAPAIADGLVGAAAVSLDPTAEPAHLALWHGLNLALLLSAITLAGGALIVMLTRPMRSVLHAGERIPTGTEVYLVVLRGLNVLADRLTAIVQNGSLPIYAGVTLLTAALVPGIALVATTDWPSGIPFVDRPGEVAVVATILTAAIAACAVRRRFSAALFLGTVGYGMAGLFVLQGAPDLALTQVAIETLSTVLFVLVLRRLPDRFERTSTARWRVVRVLISATVGVSVLCFAAMTRAARTAPAVSTEMVARSLPDGHGRNVVNVILVDFRGFDTLGEITVLTTAAIGAVALARAGRRRVRPRPDASGGPPGEADAELMTGTAGNGEPSATEVVA